MDNNLYIAINYNCNHKCTCCPCSLEYTSKSEYLSLDEIKTFIKNRSYSQFTVSGGEPTMNPNFFEIVEYLSKLGNLIILSNADRFSEVSFFSKFLTSIDKDRVTVITTLHSYQQIKHEATNKSVGSFNRTLIGLKNLYDNNVLVCVKHCITPNNYQDLPLFVRFIYEQFPLEVSLQFSGIDYTGMQENDKISAKNMKFFDNAVMNALDEVIKYEKKGVRRRVYCLSIPLCHVDPYYWKYFYIKKNQMYDGYLTNKYHSYNYTSSDLGLFSKKCLKCNVKNYCFGSYKSAFDLYGDDFVNPIIEIDKGGLQ